MREAGRVAGVIGLVGAAVSVGARSASGAFSAIRAATNQQDSGTISLQLPPSGGVNRLTVNVPQILPGESFYRAFDLKIAGTVGFNSVGVLPNALTSTALDTDQVNGLQYTLDVCGTAWTESGSSPNFTYTCPGGSVNVIGPSPIGAGTKVLANLNLTPGATNHLRLTTQLPSTAPSSMQGLTSDIQFTFDGAPRSGTNK